MLAISQRLKRSESGFTLIELIVAMAIFAVAMTLIVGLFTGFTTRFTEQRAATDSAAVAALGMNELTKVVRAGTKIKVRNADPLEAFVSATDKSMVLYAYLASDAALSDDTLGSAPVRVRFSISATGELTEERWDAIRSDEYWTFSALPASAVKPRVVARKIILPTAAAVLAGNASHLFTYLDVDGNPIPTPITTRAKDIRTVKITMSVQADVTSRADPVQIQNRVGLPNLVSSRMGKDG
ncbi:type II secretion system protein [Glaciihabitans arcticus]|uniref:Type II secretion system protein n=1 Tax=Glaciihabitans arcticus TaxID=2668039 RepID=A0A4Q9GX84_9MICO|nr:type II secretion system protein [Glaciihabitans arcticus]TBN57847.1 type II secretion system protein [Glaciihabitans arcticus]